MAEIKPEHNQDFTLDFPFSEKIHFDIEKNIVQKDIGW